MDTTETKVYVAILIIAAVTGIILVNFIISIIRNQKRTMILQKEKMQVELSAMENERKRIAADLHDELGPLLSSVRLQMGCINSTDGEDLTIVHSAATHIDTILYRLREISNGLMPHVLLRKGLVAAIKEFTDGINNVRALTISFHCNEEILLTDETQIHLFRIVQEITHNVLKHAEATILVIRLRIAAEKLCLEIGDNGKGFDEQAVFKAGRGLGLTNIARRVEMLNGNLYLDTTPGTGTAFTIEVPLK